MNAFEFDMETFDALVKDIRNARRTIVDPNNDTEVLQARKEELTKAINAASRAADLDSIRENTNKLSKVLAKLEGGPQEAIAKFDDALAKLQSLVAGEPVTTETAEAA